MPPAPRAADAFPHAPALFANPASTLVRALTGRDVAALRLMGISRRTVVASVMVEASVIAVLGSLAGIGLGAISSAIVNWYYRGVYRTPLAFSLVTPEIVALAVGLSIGLGMAAGYVAARRLVAQRPLALIGR